MEMNVLDEKYEYTEAYKDEPHMPVILKFGGIGSAILAVIVILSNTLGGEGGNNGFDMSFMLSILLGFLNIVAYVALMIFAVLSYKKLNRDIMSLGKGFIIAYLTGLMMAVVSIIFSLIWIYFFGLPQASREGLQAMDSMFENDNTTFMVMAAGYFFSFLLGCAVGAVIALIIAAITKRERPISFNVS